jgi:hypothetical protein
MREEGVMAKRFVPYIFLMLMVGNSGMTPWNYLSTMAWFKTLLSFHTPQAHIKESPQTTIKFPEAKPVLEFFRLNAIITSQT